jgi:hypothetical protein
MYSKFWDILSSESILSANLATLTALFFFFFFQATLVSVPSNSRDVTIILDKNLILYLFVVVAAGETL